MNFDFSQFGCNVFSDTVMRDKLPKSTYKELKKSIESSQPLTADVAEIVAEAMKDWAVEKGATHFTHWFQPMTNITAGKLDSFISPTPDGKIILEFSGKELTKGEPDASSFPNGGLRNTFEARGYTMWDCTSPAFIKDHTLYIPTAFCSYTGEALDAKTPLLRSMEVISNEAMRLLRAFGNTTSKRVIVTVGAEQEYFLIDRELYEKRLDLKICGRTLLGAKPPKGQEMEDHYFGRIRIRIADYMRQLDEELWKLGVTAKTKHNEVAPAQHELAPVFDSVNIACDHNQLTMELMRTIAKKNGLACLLHEKPFAHINGSGKHNNWSLCTDDGINLFEPGKNPYENIQFLTFLCAVITAVDQYADLLRLSAAIAGNDYRLGANEAPPAIISIFLGEQLTSVLHHIAEGEKPQNQMESAFLQMGVETLPKLKKDDSDRNRTSPFAFTGNKFEFRMVGSSASIACANYILNTIVADVLSRFTDRLTNSKDFDGEIRRIIRDTMQQHGRIIFNGNNYTQEWVEEARRRGLPNLSNTVDAAAAYLEPKNISVLGRNHVLSEVECQSRYEILLENYSHIIMIEANTLLEMVKKLVIPASVEYIGSISDSYLKLKETGIQNHSIYGLLQNLSSLLDGIVDTTNRLEELVSSAPAESSLETAEYYRDQVLPKMEQTRTLVDRMEVVTDKKKWPMPSYTDLLHRV